MLPVMMPPVATLHAMPSCAQRISMSRLMPAIHAQPGKQILQEMMPRLATPHARRSVAFATSM
jgi:hypothetical protein